jgi:ATP-dependent Clp protease ATP-binding subunit ClpX
LVEGTVVNVKSGRKGPGQQDTVPMDTTDILFVGSGAFTGLERIVGQRLDKRSVGFGSASYLHSVTKDDKEQSLVNEKRDKLFAQADQGDLIKFGIVPELVGRFPVLVPFHSFNQEMLVRVLSEPANSLISQMKYQFAMDGVDLEFLDDALEEIAQLAMERKTGARALRSIVEKVLLAPKFEVPGSNIKGVAVTKSSVQGKESCIYRREQEEPEIVEEVTPVAATA